MRWPSHDEVHAAAAQWARRLVEAELLIVAVGYFGSHARGQASVGSDLDLVVIVDAPATPERRAGGAWALEDLPVPADLLVYTLADWTRFAESQTRFYRTLAEETVWVWGAPPTTG